MSEVEGARKYIKERYGFIFKKTGPKVRDEHVVIADGFTPIPTVEMALYAALENEVIKRLSAPVVAPIVGGSADKQAASILSQARVRGFEMYDHDWKGIKGGEFVFTLDVPASVFEGRSVEEVENELRAVTTK